MDNPAPQSQRTAASLYLRTDGTLMLVSGDREVEILLTPAQLLKLGIDMLSLATTLNPSCMAAAVEALSSTYILHHEAPPCRLPN